MHTMLLNTWLNDILETIFLSNTIKNYLICLVILVGIYLFKRFIIVNFTRLLYFFIKKYSLNLPVKLFTETVRKPLELFIFLLLFYTSFSFLKWPIEWNLDAVSEFGLKMVVLKSYQILITASITWILIGVVNFIALVIVEEKKRKEEDDQLTHFLRELSKVLLWIFYFFFALGAIFKLDVASIITGLGIGGLAVALAGKETLENLIASFTIFLDKPFKAGDSVRIDGSIEGEIERIGFRSTRIRSFDKSYITIPNKIMVDKPVDNLTQREFRRARFHVWIEHDTANYKIEKLQRDVEHYVINYPMSSGYCRVIFDNFGAVGIELLIFYYIKTPIFEEFIHEKDIINLKIKELIESNEIKIAFVKDPHYGK
jgi:MscS family membrane protein